MSDEILCGDGIPENPFAELAKLKEADPEVIKLRAEIERLKEERRNAPWCKISEKTGAVCLYGLQRFPISLYANQWEKLKDLLPEVLRFIEENKDRVARPPPKEK